MDNNLGYGDAPFIAHGVGDDYRRLFYSNEIAALTVPVTIQAGYGVLKLGTAMAKNLSANSPNTNKLVPYCPTSFDATVNHPGRAFLVTDSGATASDLYVTIADSYKFAVGDDVIINSSGVSAENLGKITAIDRTSEQHRAKITVTTATGGSSFTTAQYAHILVEAGTSGNNYSDCVGILMKSVDTGTINGKGAIAELVWGNCILYEGALTNMDSAAKTDISATSFGQYLCIR